MSGNNIIKIVTIENGDQLRLNKGKETGSMWIEIISKKWNNMSEWGTLVPIKKLVSQRFDEKEFYKLFIYFNLSVI